MRGPNIRVRLDIRRLWRCPVCQYERRAHADQTSIRCHCSKDAPFMKLVEQQRTPRPVPEVLPQYFEYVEDEFDPVEEVAEFVAIESDSTLLTDDSLQTESVSSVEEETGIDSSDSFSDDEALDDTLSDQEPPPTRNES